MTDRARSAVSRFRLRHALANGVPGTLAGSLIAAYLAALLRLDPASKPAFVWAVIASLGVMTPLGHWMERRAQRDLLRVLAAEAEDRLSPELVRLGYRAALRLPLAGLAWQALCWPVAGVVVLVTLGLQHALDPFRALAVACSALTGGAIVLPFAYYALRDLARPVRERLAARLSLEDQTELSLVVPLRWKLVAPTAVLCVATFVFAALFAHTAAVRPVEAHDARIKQAFLAFAAEALRAGRQDLAALDALARELGAAERVFVVAAAADPGAVDAALLTPAERSFLALGAPRGDGRDLASPHSFAWQRLEPSGDLLVASTPVASLGVERGNAYVVLASALGIVLGSALLLGRLLVRDVAGTTARLTEAFERVRGGDLRVLPAVGVDDELGRLGRAFAGVTAALRATLERAGAAADRVEEAAGQVSQVSAALGAASASQVASLERAAAATTAIDRQVSGITESSETLTRNVEEASSSVLELGAAAEQLHQTSQSLNGQVDEVGSSLAQMVRSVSHVEESAQKLAEASLETSSSLTQMGRATREADGHAVETERLSRRVVELAESGLVRMRRSSEGMEAIREASESARSVIQGLAGRVADIGKVVDVIDDVADETNLLALNAAIIAAQAGDRGRAFSVVADEIKDLAERVLSSTKEIAALIGSVRSESARAEQAVELGTARVHEGVELSAGVAAALEEITTAARDCGQRTQEIVAVVSEHARASGHAGRLMEGVNGHVQGIRRAVAEQAQAHEVVMRSVTAMRDLAHQTQRTAEEQARGSARIRDGMEAVCDVGERIHVALREQSEACRSAASFLEQIHERTSSLEGSARSLLEADAALEREVGGLRADLQRFRLGEESA